MKKLEITNFGVQELNTNERREINGGGWGILEKAVEYLVTAFIEDVVQHPEKIVSPNAHRTALGHMGGARP